MSERKNVRPGGNMANGDTPEQVAVCLSCAKEECPGTCAAWRSAGRTDGRRRGGLYEANGRRQTLAAWAEETGISADCLRMRMNHGKTMAQAIGAGPSRRDKAGRRYALGGEARTIAEWAMVAGISPECLRQRLRRGWSLRQAVEGDRDERVKTYEAFGERLTTDEWARRRGVSPDCLRHRLASGMSLEDALSMPAVGRPGQRLRIEWQGVEYTLAGLARALGVSYRRLQSIRSSFGGDARQAAEYLSGQRDGG